MEDRVRPDWDGMMKQTYVWIRGRGGRLFRDKVAAWARVMGVEYNRITVKNVTSIWGSCSARSNLNFSWKVFALPERLVDYLVVHELAHLKHLDHSPQFWALVGSFLPDYRKRKKELERYV